MKNKLLLLTLTMLTTGVNATTYKALPRGPQTLAFMENVQNQNARIIETIVIPTIATARTQNKEIPRGEFIRLINSAPYCALTKNFKGLPGYVAQGNWRKGAKPNITNITVNNTRRLSPRASIMRYIKVAKICGAPKELSRPSTTITTVDGFKLQSPGRLSEGLYWNNIANGRTQSSGIMDVIRTLFYNW